MRCFVGFICQFGLASDPAANDQFLQARIKDDPNWLPPGPENRENKEGVERFARGYLAFAGFGKDSRSNQFIVSLDDSGPLAGGNPWEVPLGELVGRHSYDTLKSIYTGYGDNGPTQAEINTKGMTSELKDKYPKLDYILSCEVTDEERQF